jgi:hypothetical protein
VIHIPKAIYPPWWERWRGVKTKILMVHNGIVVQFVVGLFAVLCVVGCEKRSGEAVVLAKEHIAAASGVAQTSGSESNNIAKKASADAAVGADHVRPLTNDEITIDSYVMKPEVRGTSRDPRALKNEQWLVKVRMITDGHTFNVQADQSQFDKLGEGDRVQVRYRVGKYTKTIWGAEIIGRKK